MPRRLVVWAACCTRYSLLYALNFSMPDGGVHKFDVPRVLVNFFWLTMGLTSPLFIMDSNLLTRIEEMHITQHV
jgi:hypothetical protein